MPRVAPRYRGNASGYRLSGPAAFEALFRSGRRREGAYLQLVYAPAGTPPGKVGFVLARKALPRAVDRNRVRRMMRERIHAARPAIEAYDLIVRLKRGCPRSAFRAVADEAARLLSELPAGAVPGA